MHSDSTPELECLDVIANLMIVHYLSSAHTKSLAQAIPRNIPSSRNRYDEISGLVHVMLRILRPRFKK